MDLALLRRIEALERLIAELGTANRTQFAPPLRVIDDNSFGRTVGVDTSEAAVNTFATTGAFLRDAFAGFYDDKWDSVAQTWEDVNDITSLTACWLVDDSLAKKLPPASRWIGVLQDDGIPGPAGPFYIALNNRVLGDTSDTDNWLEVVTDPENVLDYPIVVVSTTALADGQLAINTPPDFAAQLSIIITDSGSAITAGDLVLVDPTQAGTETISLVGGTATYITSNYYTSAMSANITGLMGGSSTTIEIEVYEYPPGVLLNYSGNTWIDNVLDTGPPTDGNWTKVSLPALTDDGTISINNTYSTGDYGQRALPIVLIQSDGVGGGGYSSSNPPVTYCQLLAEATGVWRTLTDDDGNVFCLFVPDCQEVLGACQPSTGPAGGSCPTVSWPPTICATWTARGFYVLGGVDVCYTQTFHSTLTFQGPVDQTNGTYSGVYTGTSQFLSSSDPSPLVPATPSMNVTITAYCCATDGSTIWGVTDCGGVISTTPDPPVSGVGGGLYDFTYTGYYNGPGMFTGYYIGDPPCADAGPLNGSQALSTSVGACGSGNPIIKVGPSTPITPPGVLLLSASNPSAPLTPTTFTMSQTNATTLAGSFTLPGVSGTITYQVQYMSTLGRYYASAVNSNLPNDYSGSFVSVSGAAGFTLGSVALSPVIGGSNTRIVVTQPAGLVLASASASTVAASTSTIAVGNPVTVTVTLLSAGSAPVPNKLVTLAATGSSTGNGATAITNASGVAAFTVTDSTAESITYSAVDTTDSVTVTATASVTYTSGSMTTITSAFFVNSGGMSFPVASQAGMSVGTALTIHCVRTSDSATFTVTGIVTALGASVTIGSVTINSPGNSGDLCNTGAVVTF